jgi:hypothetical protein
MAAFATRDANLIKEMTKFDTRVENGYIDVVGEIQRGLKACRNARIEPEMTSDQEGQLNFASKWV